MKKTHAVLTVFGQDRPGIIRDISGILCKRGCNLEDVSMTILEGQFAMMMTVAFNQKNVMEAIRSDMSRATKKMKSLKIYLDEIHGKVRRGNKHRMGTRPYLITAMGNDRSGIIYELSKALAQRKINITDLNSRILGDGKKTIYVVLLETDVPASVTVKTLKGLLTRVGKKKKVEVSVRPMELIEL